MVLRMKSVNILWVHRKIWLLRGGWRDINIEGGDKEDWQEREGWWFCGGGGLRPQCPQWHLLRSVYVNKFCKSTRNGCLTDSWKYFCTINALFVGFFSVFNYKFLVSKMIMRWLLFRICKHSNSWWVLPKTVLKTNIAFKKLIYLLLNAIVNLFKYTKFLLPHFLIHCHEELKIFANLVL